MYALGDAYLQHWTPSQSSKRSTYG